MILEALRRWGGTLADSVRRSSDSAGRPGVSVTPPHFSDESRPATEAFDRLGLSSEEYILELVEATGGRVRQKTICAESDWSKSTVSRVLSDMEGTGTISRIRVGREKIVCLPEETPPSPAVDPTIVESPEETAADETTADD